jgi:ubiquitin-conjugating enzyme E2 Q
MSNLLTFLVFPAITWGEHYAPQRHSSTKPASARTSGAQTPLDNTTQVAAVNEFRPATFYIYDQNFDQLPDQDKMAAVYALLDVLPSVAEMGRYLKRRIQSPLSSWVDRLSPAVLGILRWIIASNRACIMQIEDDDSEERVHGMHGWSQFRFAMGAPDKERRFVKAVRETSARLGLKYPTIFAFHGSPLRNWHSIIREGLHFREISHGRAYGNGVYHSQDLFTSMGYSNGFNAYWQGSELKISQVSQHPSWLSRSGGSLGASLSTH